MLQKKKDVEDQDPQGDNASHIKENNNKDSILVVNSVPLVAKLKNTENSILEDDELLSINTQENIDCEDVSASFELNSKKHNIEMNSSMVSNKKLKTSIGLNTKAKESTTFLEKQTKQMSINDDVTNETGTKDVNSSHVINCDKNVEPICSQKILIQLF